MTIREATIEAMNFLIRNGNFDYCRHCVLNTPENQYSDGCCKSWEEDYESCLRGIITYYLNQNEKILMPQLRQKGVKNMIKTTIWGNLAADPELREVEVGEEKKKRSLCVFTVISNRFGKATPSALRVEVWGSNAENIAKYLKKGSGCVASGDLDIDTYEKDGIKHVSVKLTDADVQFTDKAPKKE